MAARLTTTLSGLHCNYMVDITQNGHRKPWSVQPRSICGDSKLFFFPRGRALVAVEHLLLMGWKATTNVSGATAHQVRDLAGEAMAPPCVGMATLSLALALPEFWTNPAVV
eukprot:5734399-Amphidinium_carterae.1